MPATSTDEGRRDGEDLEALTHLAGQLDGIVRNELETREAIARMDGQLDIIRIQIGRLDPHTATRVHGRHARGRNNA